MTAKETLQPKLRFPGFEGDWGKNVFENLVKINQGLQIPISERFLEEVENSHFYITNEFLKEGSQKKYFIKNPTQSVLCTEDDILMTRTGNTGMVVTNVKGAFHNNFFKIQFPEAINKDFLYYFLVLDKTQNLIKSLAGTSTIPDLNHSDFYKIEFVYPSLQEQTKIANFLSSIDEKINLLKEKKALLEEYKKGMMQKIFNQEIRFKDDNGNDFEEWEEKSLRDVLSIPEKNRPKEIDVNKLLTVKLHLKGVHKNANTESLSIGSTNYIIRKKGQFIYGKQNLFNGAFAIIPEELDGFLSSGDVPTLDINKDKLKGDFLLYLFSRKEFYNNLENLATGSGSKRIHEKTLLDLSVSLPCLKEQTKIANFLSAIDEKIVLVATQIEDMQEYKKGLLQQMFV